MQIVTRRTLQEVADAMYEAKVVPLQPLRSIMNMQGTFTVLEVSEADWNDLLSDTIEHC